MHMTIRLTGGDRGSRTALGVRLDRLGIHDWATRLRDGEADRAEMPLQVTDLDGAALEGLANWADSGDAELLRRVAALPRMPLLDGNAAYLKRVLHGVHNALTPALISVSMTREILERVALSPAELGADLHDVETALTAAQSRIAAITQLADGRPITVDVRAVMEFLDRPDSVLRTLAPCTFRFDLEAAPQTRIQPACLESWLLTLAAAWGAETGSTLSYRLGSKPLGGAHHACIAVTFDPGRMEGRHASAFASVQRSAIAQGAHVSATPRGIEIMLPPLRPTPHANGYRALVGAANPRLRARLNAVLLAAGYLTTEAKLPHLARAQVARYGQPAVVILDARCSAAWGPDAPPHIVVADLETPVGRSVPMRTQWLSPFASPACIRRAAARQVA